MDGNSSRFVCILFLIGLISACGPTDEERYKSLSEEERHDPENALLGLDVREGLEAQLFAAEDMIVNPTNMDIDAKGRIWVTEGVNYRSELNPDNPVQEEGDRILILEDTDGDGKADSRTVFYQGNDINSALGIMVLDDKVIVSRSPDIFVFTDTDGDGQADEKEVLFTGMSGEEHDHGVHAFVFGPDGNLYFNFGNEGRQITDPAGNIIVDKAGNEVRAGGEPYRQGMVFRTDMEGKDFEVVAHNFRNNYEVALDSYGTLWQSDNDDDGNRAVRINYVMEYGNYGFRDEMTGADWRSRRTGMADDVPVRHWHQNDPGVVPNLLLTGAGSPTGITIYEGDLLPEIFHNQMIHTDAGPNVVRSYPVEKEGAGYNAEIENIMEGKRNQWFRPSDVTVAPDGSIFVADWYDPGVGGHQMADQEKGRIFRIAPENTPYEISGYSLDTPKDAVEALKSPNHELRAKAWVSLHEQGADAEAALADLWQSENDRFRARALWLLSKIDGEGEEYINQALDDENEDIRITGLRAARQLDLDSIPMVARLVEDSSAQVRREAAVALRHQDSPEAPELWAELAAKHDGQDRWYLEALGIGADRQWDPFFKAWLDKVNGDWKTEAGRNIVWRARTAEALPMLAEVIRDAEQPEDMARYFRAFDFHTSDEKQQILVELLEGDQPNQRYIDLLALQHLDRSAPEHFPQVSEALDRSLEASRGTYDFFDLVDHYRLEDQHEPLADLVVSFPDSSLGVSAARHMIEYGGTPHLENMLQEEEQAKEALQALSGIGSDPALALIETVALDEGYSRNVRQKAVESFGSGGWNGEDKLLELLKEQKLSESLQSTAANVLMNAYRPHIREEATQFLPASEQNAEADLAPVSELVEKEGDIEQGREVFERTCQMCHQVDGRGTNFGPDLTEIGNKLPQEALYEAILEPNAGINFGYEGNVLTLEDDSQVSGIIESETDSEIVLRLPGGLTNEYDKSEVVSKEEMDQSLMPALQSSMSEQELVDLVEYLMSLEN